MGYVTYVEAAIFATESIEEQMPIDLAFCFNTDPVKVYNVRFAPAA